MKIHFLLAVILLASSCRFVPFSKSEVTDFSSRLGYTEENEISFHHSCWDIFYRCGNVLQFKTNLSADAINSVLQQKSPSTQVIDGYSLFTWMNLESRNGLTLNGNDGLLNRSLLPEPLGYGWIISEEGYDISVYFYETGSSNYLLGSEELKSNIAVVIFQKKG